MPKPRKRDGVSLKALAGEEAPRLLPVITEAVPPRGRPLSVFEKDALSDWGLFITTRTGMRVVPTATPGEFSLWRVSRHAVRKLQHLLTFAGSVPDDGGTWITTGFQQPTKEATMNEKPTRTDAENDLLLAAQACTALTAQLVEHCEKFAREQGLQRGELGSSLLVAGVEMFARDGGIEAARNALRAALQKLAEDQQKAQSVN